MKSNYVTANSTLLDKSLFVQWEQELTLRRQLRTSTEPGACLQIKSEDDVKTLWRALYFTDQKATFWSLLAENMHLTPVLKWLTADESNLETFLAFLPAYLRHNKLDYKKLQYLVNLFKEKYTELFVLIVDSLDMDVCSFLVSRSANPQWRKIFNQRLQFLQEKKASFFYGLDKQIEDYSLNSIQGDKIKLIAQGIELINKSMNQYIDKATRFEIMMEAADIFFRAGMIDDSLLLLKDLYQEYQAERTETDDQISKRQFDKLLRKTIPVYCLINRADAPGLLAASIYQNFFPDLQPDQVTQKYFHIYNLIKHDQESANNNLFRIAFAAEQLSFQRFGEHPLLSKSDLDNGLDEVRVNALKDLAEQKLISLPHEAFITLQLMLLLINKQLADSSLANFILHKALLLFQWIPCSIFINNSFLENLAPLIDDESRYEAGKIAEQIALFKSMGFLTGLDKKSELFKSKDAAFLRQIAAGKFLGVL